MRFLLFPTSANNKSGYGIAVSSDFRRLKVDSDDRVLWYTDYSDRGIYYRDGDSVLLRQPRNPLKLLRGIIMNRLRTEISHSDLKHHYDMLNQATEIWCGDYIFYRAIRKLFPTKRLVVRFHNVHYRNKIRADVFNIRLDFKYRQLLRICSNIEKEIFNDSNVVPIFISKEDQEFYELTTRRNDSILWDIAPNDKMIVMKRKEVKLEPVNQIVFLGGLSSHKVRSIQYFISHIWSKLVLKHENLQFHLFGKGTEAFNDESLRIYGHGFLDSEDFPFASSSLYINPDLIGGGVKVKVLSLLENAIPFITNNFGYEGYDIKYKHDQFCIIRDIINWDKEIDKQINERKQ